MTTTPDANGPWLYLDTADLISIGDQKVSEELAAQLVQACRHSNAILIISRWHIIDLRAAPQDAALRVFDAADRFPTLATINLHDEGANIVPLQRVADLANESPIELGCVNDLATLIADMEQTAERLDPAIPQRRSNNLAKLWRQMLLEETEDAAMNIGKAYLHNNRRMWPPQTHGHILTTMLSKHPYRSATAKTTRSTGRPWRCGR